MLAEHDRALGLRFREVLVRVRGTLELSHLILAEFSHGGGSLARA
jgi:hypothetical protein